MGQLFGGTPNPRSVAIVRAAFPELAALSDDTLMARMERAEREMDDVRTLNWLQATDALPDTDDISFW